MELSPEFEQLWEASKEEKANKIVECLNKNWNLYGGLPVIQQKLSNFRSYTF
jgi:hypothetical protein